MPVPVKNRHCRKRVVGTDCERDGEADCKRNWQARSGGIPRRLIEEAAHIGDFRDLWIVQKVRLFAV